MPTIETKIKMDTRSQRNLKALFHRGERKNELATRRVMQRNRRTLLQERGITLATPTHSQSRERVRRLRQTTAGRLQP
jgi:hypothetical protein